MNLAGFAGSPSFDHNPGGNGLPEMDDARHGYGRSIATGFTVIALVVVFSGFTIYRSAKNSVTHTVNDNLRVIATLKATQIDHWMDEKKDDIRDDMKTEFEKPELAGLVRHWLGGGMHDAVVREQLLGEMQRIIRLHRYLEISLRSTRDGALLLNTADESDTLATRAKAMASVGAGKTTLEDFHIETTNGVARMHIGFFNTLHIGTDRRTALVVDVTLDASEVLFPLILQWPGWNNSAETLLLRRDGNDAIVLNTLRGDPHSAMRIRFPVSMAQSIPVMALHAGTGPLLGFGYKNNPAIAYTLPVPETPWTLVAEVDEKDAYAKLNTITALTSAIIALLMFSCAWWLLEHIRYTMARIRHESERKLLTTRIDYLAKYANDCIMLCDAIGRIMEINDRCLTTYGYTREEFLRMNLCDLRPSMMRFEMPKLLRRIAEGSGLLYESEHQRKDGTTLHVEISASLIDVDGRPCYQAIIRDISVRIKLQAEREKHIRRLNELTHRLVTLQEEERRRLSVELHDRIGANLATLNLDLRGISNLLPPPRAQRLEEILADSSLLLTDTITSIREYCADLRPAVLDYSGLLPALKELIHRFGKRSGVTTRFRHENMNARLPEQAESMLFRIAQEALTNCAKHADAKTVDVDIEQQGGNTILTITDDGVGFDQQLLGSPDHPVGLGLLTMRERAELADGKLFILSSPGKGTQIKVMVEVREGTQSIGGQGLVSVLTQ